MLKSALGPKWNTRSGTPSKFLATAGCAAVAWQKITIGCTCLAAFTNLLIDEKYLLAYGLVRPNSAKIAGSGQKMNN
jgi:hypothetical protein